MLANRPLCRSCSNEGSRRREKTSTGELDDFPSKVRATDPAVALGDGSALIIDNPIALQGGKLSGQQTTPASYDDFGTAINGTLVVKYTLTPR